MRTSFLKVSIARMETINNLLEKICEKMQGELIDQDSIKNEYKVMIQKIEEKEN